MTIKQLVGIGLTALKSNVRMLDRPYKLNFAVTLWCQSRCRHCSIWELKPKGELTIDEIREFARRNTSFRWIELTGGEPFLRSDIVEIARAFHESSRGLYILTMPTNSLCKQEMVVSRIREMLELGIPRMSITVSLDGHRELHDMIRGIPGNYDRAIGLFKALRELKRDHPNLFFVFGYTMTKMNEGQFGRTYEEVKREIPDIRYNDFHMNVGQISGNYYHNESGNGIVPTGSEVAKEIEAVLRKRRFEVGIIPSIEEIFLKNLVYYARTGNTPMKSRSMEASLFLDSFGNVYPSIMWNRKIANVRDIEYDLARVWNGAEASEVRESIRRGEEPKQWTACEAYQSIVGHVPSFIRARGRA